MVSSGASSSRTCPACGARNSELSIFCAECGSGLNGDPWQDDGQTQAFQPAASGNSPAWNTPADSEHRTNSGTHAEVIERDETAQVRATPAYSTFGGSTVAASWPPSSDADQHGARGFVLGTLGWLLILAVFGLYLWSSVLSDGLKDDILDLIPGLSTILLHA